MHQRPVELLGWRCLCLSENHVADRAHFIQAYQLLRQSTRRDTRRLQLVHQFIAALQVPDQPQLISGQPVKE